MRLDDAVDRFFTGYFATHERSPKTIAAYRIDLRQFIEHTGADTPLDSIKADFMEQWAASLKRAEYAPASIRRKFASVRVFFNYWVRHEEIFRSPLWNLRLDLAPAKRLPKALTLRELQLLLGQTEAELEEAAAGKCQLPLISEGKLSRYFLAVRDRAIIELMCATGIRVGEAVALQLRDYNLIEGDLLVRGKGARERFSMLCDGRSRVAVEQYLGCRAQLELDHQWFFVNTRQGPITTQGISKILRKFARRADLVRSVTPHMLRHTFATLLLRSGADIRIVQRAMGHSSITMTAQYTHVSRQDIVSALALYQRDSVTPQRV